MGAWPSVLMRSTGDGISGEGANPQRITQEVIVTPARRLRCDALRRCSFVLCMRDVALYDRSKYPRIWSRVPPRPARSVLPTLLMAERVDCCNSTIRPYAMRSEKRDGPAPDGC